MTVPVSGAVAETEFEYSDASSALPGTLKKVTIVTRLAGGESKVVLEILGAKRRHVLPGKMFDVE